MNVGGASLLGMRALLAHTRLKVSTSGNSGISRSGKSVDDIARRTSRSTLQLRRDDREPRRAGPGMF